MDLKVENINGLLMRSKLLTPAEVLTNFARFQGEAKDNATSTPHYLKWMIRQQILTDYQATLIGKGHADDFFLNDYKILDRLGRGRMAGVYKAVHHSGQVVAIKVLPPSRAKDNQFLARFQREARIAMRLKHPNVVRSFQVGTSGELHYLVMEHLEGETLEDVLQRRKKLPPNEAVRLIYQALLGLQHIHEQGVVHRDLKPSNLMLVPGRIAGEADNTLLSTVKILDIGLGRELFDEQASAALQNLELTGEGMLLGTPDYLAPEQARDARSIDIRADIYSLGCVLYHCLTGQPPFPDTNILNQMVRHATEEPKPIRTFNSSVPEGLQQIVGYMMAKDPTKRYATPERAAQGLQVFLVAGSEITKNAEETPQMRRFLTWLDTSPDSKNSDATTQLPAPVLPPIAPTTTAAALSPSAARPTTPLPSPETLKVARPAPTPIRPPTPAPDRPAKAAPHPLKASGKSHYGSKKHKKHKHGGGAKAAAPNPTPAPTRPDAFDVELVAVPPPPTAAPPAAPTAAPAAKSPAPAGKLALTQRDWLLLGIGAGGVLAATVLGWILARLF